MVILGFITHQDQVLGESCLGTGSACKKQEYVSIPLLLRRVEFLKVVASRDDSYGYSSSPWKIPIHKDSILDCKQVSTQALHQNVPIFLILAMLCHFQCVLEHCLQ